MATLIVKATEKCNSNCYYCDVVRKKHTGNSMSLEILETIFLRINEFLKCQIEEEVELLWHGGEPLLLGPEYFRSALDLQETHCPETKTRIRHSMQTNLTLFSEAYVDIFRKMGITAVGTSYDPEPHVRGPGKEIDSAAYNRMFMEGLGVLEKHGFGWGMIYVVTKKSLARPLDVFFFLTNLQLTGGINLNPVLIYDDQRKDIAITPEEYVDFLGAIFPYWWPYRERYPHVEPYKSLVDNIIEGKTTLTCMDSGECTYHHINVAPDGETSQCGRSADWELLRYGNIKERSLAEILHDKQREQLEKRVQELRNMGCKGCRFWELCHGGCPLDAYSQHQSFMYKSEWCEARKGFIEKYFEPITGTRFEPKNR
jgi:uncharacterized protein